MVKSQFSSLKAWLGVLAAFVLIMTAGLARHYIFYPEPEEPPSVAVRAHTVESEDVLEKREYTGQVESVSRVNVQAQISGEVLRANYREGDRVEAGEVLAQIDDSEVRARLEALRARRRSAEEVLASQREELTAARAEKEYLTAEKERHRNLFERGLTPESQFEEIESKQRQAVSRVENLAARVRSQREQVEAISEEINEAQTRLSYATVRAPVSGVVVDQNLEAGELAQPARSLYVLDSGSGYRVRFSYPQEDVPLIATGQEVLLHLPEETRRGLITRIHGALTSHSLATAEVDLPELPESLKSGSYVSLEVIHAHHQEVPVVPEQAVLSRDDSRYVYLLEEGQLRQREVEAGPTEDRRTVVRELEPGTEVATGAFLELSRNYDGQPVTVYEDN